MDWRDVYPAWLQISDGPSAVWRHDGLHHPRVKTPLAADLILGAMTAGKGHAVDAVGFPCMRGSAWGVHDGYVYMRTIPREGSVREGIQQSGCAQFEANVADVMGEWATREASVYARVTTAERHLRVLAEDINSGSLGPEDAGRVLISVRSQVMEAWAAHFDLLSVGYLIQKQFIYSVLHLTPTMPTADALCWMTRTDSTSLLVRRALNDCAKGIARRYELTGSPEAVAAKLRALLPRAANEVQEVLAVIGDVVPECSLDFGDMAYKNSFELLGRDMARSLCEVERHPNGRTFEEWLRCVPEESLKAELRLRHQAAVTVTPFLEDHSYAIEQKFHTQLWDTLTALGAILVECASIREPRDIAMLHVREIIDIARGWPGAKASYDAVVRHRRACLEQLAQRPAVPVIGSGADAVSADPALSLLFGWGEPLGMDRPALSERGCVLTGVAVSAGAAEGVGVSQMRNAADLEGMVVLADDLSGAQAACLAGATAVVTRRGGVLAHSAVVLRELGVPAVFNVSGLDLDTADGRRIVVDGNAGRVTVKGVSS